MKARFPEARAAGKPTPFPPADRPRIPRRRPGEPRPEAIPGVAWCSWGLAWDRDRRDRAATGSGARDLARLVDDLQEVIRELPEDVPESERRDLLDDSRDHGNTRAACPGWPNYRAGGAVALRRVAVVRSDLTS